MKGYTKSDIINLIQEEDVRFIRLQFTDILGRMRNIAVTNDKIEEALNGDCSFDATLIEGFSDMTDTDLYLVPDLDTFAIFPWRPHDGRVARFICDVCTKNGEHFDGDSRWVLKKAVSEAKSMGYQFNVGAECEFFLFKTDDAGNPTLEPHDEAEYFDLAPLDNGENCRRDICLTLEEMGFLIESSHHEAAAGQHEIDVRFSDALKSADQIITLKTVVKTIAKRNGIHATFMPKPKAGIAGSGMHTNMSLSKDGENVFYDRETGFLSDIGMSFLAGILKYVDEMMCITNPIVNSYKRIIPGFDAPCFTTWSAKNTNALIRVPDVKRPERARIEFTSPDASSNPYLVIAACLRAGLCGIKEKLTPPPRQDIDVSRLSEFERDDLGIKHLPVSLNEAVKIAKKSVFITDVLGEKLKTAYLSEKSDEYAQYRSWVSKWETDQYLFKY